MLCHSMVRKQIFSVDIDDQGDIYSTAHFRGENLAWFSLASRLSLENLLEMSWRRLLLPINTLPDINGKILF